MTEPISNKDETIFFTRLTVDIPIDPNFVKMNEEGEWEIDFDKMDEEEGGVENVLFSCSNLSNIPFDHYSDEYQLSAGFGYTY